jgi:hypothetical protein
MKQCKTSNTNIAFILKSSAIAVSITIFYCSSIALSGTIFNCRSTPFTFAVLPKVIVVQ